MFYLLFVAFLCGLTIFVLGVIGFVVPLPKAERRKLWIACILLAMIGGAALYLPVKAVYFGEKPTPKPMESVQVWLKDANFYCCKRAINSDIF